MSHELWVPGCELRDTNRKAGVEVQKYGSNPWVQIHINFKTLIRQNNLTRSILMKEENNFFLASDIGPWYLGRLIHKKYSITSYS